MTFGWGIPWTKKEEAKLYQCYFFCLIEVEMEGSEGSKITTESVLAPLEKL